ncbi:MAG: TrmH family RNA methyltransferase [Acidimicrobiales bacterium]
MTPLGPRHQRVQRLRRLVRRPAVRASERAFVVEGAKVIGEALAAGVALEALYLAPEARAEHLVRAALAAGARVHDLAPGVMEHVTDTVSPQPVIAVARSLDRSLEDLAGAADLVVVCVEVRDPGNLGTVMRSAEGAGAAGIVCCEGSVDPYNPKVVRASAGALFHVPIVVGGQPVEVLERMGEWGFRRVAADAEAPRTTAYDQADMAGRVALVVGNEAHGLPDAVREAVDEAVAIPMQGRLTSLNVGMAAAVLCFEAARQRRSLPTPEAPRR